MNKPSKQRRFDREVDGILLLDKPSGISSNSALQTSRTIFRALKAGHAGSLDPMASGMLPVCFGQATKACAFLLEAGKTYRFTSKLGVKTSTADADGDAIEQVQVPMLDAALIRNVLQRFIGRQTQIPPMYSALKHQGQRLYDLARKGETVDRAARSISIETLELEAFRGDEIDVFVRCSKGTYVRTLGEDIAAALGTVSHLIALRREQVDPFEGGAMRTLDQLQAAPNVEALDGMLIASDQALMHLPARHLDSGSADAVLSGQSVTIESSGKPLDCVRLYGPEGRFLGVGEFTPDGLLKARRLFVNRQ